MQTPDDLDPAAAAPGRGVNMPRLDLKIERARRRAEAERRAAEPFVPTPERFEKGDHKPGPGGSTP